MSIRIKIPEKEIEVRDCQYCPHHHCFWDEGNLDCSCDLSVFANPCTQGIPSTCPLGPTPGGTKEEIY